MNDRPDKKDGQSGLNIKNRKNTGVNVRVKYDEQIDVLYIKLKETSYQFAVDRTIEFLCDLVPPVPLPKIKIRLKDREDIEFNGSSEWTTWREKIFYEKDKEFWDN